MKNTIRLIAMGMAVLCLAASCKKEDPSAESTEVVVKAGFEGNTDKTYLDPEGTVGHIRWSENDQFLVGGSTGTKTCLFTLMEGEEGKQEDATFSGPAKDFNSLTGPFVAAYPSTDASISAGTVTLSLPATQTMEADVSGTFANGANPMVATSADGTSFTFKTVCGALGIPLKGHKHVRRIVLTSKKTTDHLWGDFTVDDCSAANPQLVYSSDGGNSVTLMCNVDLETTNAQWFYIMLPPGTLTEGFTLEIYNSAGENIETIETTNDLGITRNVLRGISNDILIADPPTVTTGEVTNIAQRTATGNGTVVADNGAEVTERGVCWSTSENPTIANSHAASATGGLGDFTASMTALTSNHTQYYVRAYAINSAGISYGEQVSFYTQVDLPTVSIGNINTSYSLTTTARFNRNTVQGYEITECGLCWSTSTNPTLSDNHVVFEGDHTGEVWETASLNATLTGLTPGARYYVRAYATNSVGTAYSSSSKNFYTMKVTTGNLTSITASSASCGFSLTNSSSFSITQRGICYSTSPNPTIDDFKVSASSNNATVTLSNLMSETTYYVRAYVTNSAGTGYGEEKTFTTLSGATTISPSSITTTSAYLMGKVVLTSPNSYGFVYAKASDLSNIATDLVIGGTGVTNITSVQYYSSNKIFYTTVDNLTPDEIYYVRAYASTSSITSYGEPVPFATRYDYYSASNPNQGMSRKTFSTASNRQVYFSMGNLRYVGSAGDGDASTNNAGAYWKFEDYQIKGLLGLNTTQDIQVDRGQFRWGANGNNHGANIYQPWASGSTNTNDDYWAYGNVNNPLYGDGLTGEADWGYNAIQNGGNTVNSGWRTPLGGADPSSANEWIYLLYSRPIGTRFIRAKIYYDGVYNNTITEYNGVSTAVGSTINGIIIFPDNYTHPTGIPDFISVNQTTGSMGLTSYLNNIPESQWSLLEKEGCIFISYQPYSYYATATPIDERCYSFGFAFNTDGAYAMTNRNRYSATCVRLIKDAN